MIFVEDFPQIDGGLSVWPGHRSPARCEIFGAMSQDPLEGSPVIHVHDFLGASPRFDLFVKKAERPTLDGVAPRRIAANILVNELHRLTGSRAALALAPQIIGVPFLRIRIQMGWRPAEPSLLIQLSRGPP